MDENDDVIQKLYIYASGLNDYSQSENHSQSENQSSIVQSSIVHSFTDFLLKYNLENKATSNIKIQEVLKKLNLSFAKRESIYDVHTM